MASQKTPETLDSIIRHRRSGEHFLSRIDGEGKTVALSAALPVSEARDEMTNKVDWSRFEDADMEPWDDESEQWDEEDYIIVHTF